MSLLLLSIVVTAIAATPFLTGYGSTDYPLCHIQCSLSTSP
jgi:hypothetical protein